MSVKSDDWNVGCVRENGVERCIVENGMDEFSMTPYRGGMDVRWPVGSAARGITCVTWFDDVDDARKFMMGKVCATNDSNV